MSATVFVLLDSGTLYLLLRVIMFMLTSVRLARLCVLLMIVLKSVLLTPVGISKILGCPLFLLMSLLLVFLMMPDRIVRVRRLYRRISPRTRFFLSAMGDMVFFHFWCMKHQPSADVPAPSNQLSLFDEKTG